MDVVEVFMKFGRPMKRFIPPLLLSICIGSSFLITGCGDNSSPIENSLTNADNSGETENIRELYSSTDIADVYKNNVNPANSFDVDSIEKKMTELALANSGAGSEDSLERHLIVSPEDIDIESQLSVSAESIFLEGGIYTNVSNIAVWSSSNSVIADVTQGKIHANKVGKTDITVLYRGITKTIHVNVLEKANWEEKDGSWYYYDADGKKTTGWKFINDSWYYLGNNGSMFTGWQKIKDKTYYFHSTGAMAQDNWVQDPDNGNWYYFNYNGQISRHKFIRYDNNIYYVHSDGRMATDEWIPAADGSWYYLLLDGKAARDRSIDIKGVSYTFDKNCKCLNPDGN